MVIKPALVKSCLNYMIKYHELRFFIKVIFILISLRLTNTPKERDKTIQNYKWYVM